MRILLRLGFYAIVACATMETAARVEDYLRYDAPFLRPYTIDSIFAASELGKVGVPRARYKKWILNSMGYRGPEPYANRINILTYGASEIFGLYESPNMEFPRQLEAILNRSRPRYNVINIAIPGMSIGKLDYLAAAMDRLHPRVVIIYPSAANYIGVTVPQCGTSTPFHSRSVPIADYFRMPERVRDALKSWSPSWLLTAAQRVLIREAVQHQIQFGRVPLQTLDAFQFDLTCISTAIRAKGAIPILVTHSNAFSEPLTSADRALLTAWRRFYPQLHESGFIDLEHQSAEITRQVSSSQSIAFVDALNALPHDRVVFADFVHFTDQGAKAMAVIVAEKVEQTIGCSAD